MNGTKWVIALVSVVLVMLMPVAESEGVAPEEWYELSGEVPEYTYSGQEILPDRIQKLEPAPGCEVEFVELVGGDVVPMPFDEDSDDEEDSDDDESEDDESDREDDDDDESDRDSEDDSEDSEDDESEDDESDREDDSEDDESHERVIENRLMPKPQVNVGDYELRFHVWMTDGDEDRMFEVTAVWRIVPMQVDVSGNATKVYDGSTAVKGGISVTAGGSEDIPGITDITPLFADKDAAEVKDIRLRVVTDRMDNYRFVRSGGECQVDGKYVIVPSAGSITKATATVTGDPGREYDGTSHVTAVLTLADRVDTMKVASAEYLDSHAGTGIGIKVTMQGGDPSNYKLTFKGIPGQTEGNDVTFPGIGDIRQRSVSPAWQGEDHYFYTGEVQELPPAKAYGAAAGETVALVTSCVPADREFRDVGEYVLTAEFDGDYPDYRLVNPVGHVRMDPSPAVLTGSPDRVYDGTKAVVGVKVSGAVPDSIEFADRLAGKGKDAIMRFSDGSAENMTFSYVRADGVQAQGIVEDSGNTVLLPCFGNVSPKPVDVVWTAPPSLVYTGYELEGPAVHAVGLIDGDLLPMGSKILGGKTFRDAGAYSFAPVVLEDNPNYLVPEAVDMRYTVSQAPIDILWGTRAYTYNGSVQGFPTAEPLGIPEGDTVGLEVLILGSTVFRDAGQYRFEAVPDNPNYTVSGTSVLKTSIKPAVLTVGGSVSKVYDGDPAIDEGITVTGVTDGMEMLSATLSDPSAGPDKDLLLRFSLGFMHNYVFVCQDTNGVLDGDTVTFPGVGEVAERTISPGDVGAVLHQEGRMLRMDVGVSSGTLVCEDFTWSVGGVDCTGTGYQVAGSDPVTVTVRPAPGSDWTGEAERTFDVSTAYTVSVVSGGNGSVHGEPVSVARGTPVSSSDAVLTVGGSVFTAVPDDGYRFTAWEGVPAEGVVESDLSVTAVFAEYVPPEPPPAVVTSVEVTVPPDRVEYELGDSLDRRGMKVIATYSDGELVPVDGYEVSPAVFREDGPAVPVTVSYEGSIARIHVKVNAEAPPAPVPVVVSKVDVVVTGDVMSESEAAGVVERIEAVTDYDPEAVPVVNVSTETSEQFTVPSSLYKSVRQNGAMLSVRTVTGSVALQPGSATETEIPDDTGMRVSIARSAAPPEHAEFVGDGYVYRLSLSADGREIPVNAESATVSLKYVPGGFTDDTEVYLLSDDGSRTEMEGVTYSEVGGEAYVSFQASEMSCYSIQDGHIPVPVPVPDPEPAPGPEPMPIPEPVPEPEPEGEGQDWTIPLFFVVLMIIVIVAVAIIVRHS